MKTAALPNKSRDGSTLLIAVMLTALLGFTIAGYLGYLTQQNRISMRSEYWNECVPIAEAGIEDALMNLSQNSISNLAAGGWTAGTNCYYVNRTLSSDASLSYQAVITGNMQQITNTVIGTVTLPSYMGGPSVSRTVQVIASNAPLFSAGLVGIDTIDFNNQSVSLDCGEGASTTNTNGINLNIVANIALLNILDICLQAGVSLGPDGAAVGANAGITGIINATAATDANVQFNSVTAPIMSGLPLLNNVHYGGQTYTYAASGNTYLTALNLTGSQTLLVTGQTIIYVSGDVNIQNSASIYVAPGASLQLYVAGSSANIAGNGVVVASQDPEAFQYYGLNSNTSVTFDGPAQVQSLVYAPNAAISLGTDIETGGIDVLGVEVGGSLTLNFNGAVIGRTVTFDTATNYQYDQTVLTAGPYRGYVVYSWQEL